MLRTDSRRRFGLLVASSGLMLWSWFAAEVRGGYSTVFSHGPPSNRVNLVCLGDGYTAGEIATRYSDHLRALVDHVFDQDQDPYPRYKKYFNLYRIDLVSTESGADVPPEGIFCQTALDARYYYDGVTANSLYVDSRLVLSALREHLRDAPFAPTVVLISVNSARSGGGAGTYAVFAGGNSLGSEIALHEMGHVFNNLADEYGGIHDLYPGSEPMEVNVTTSPRGEKWAPWLGYNQPGIGLIGAYPGAYYYDQGIYAPSAGSKMRYLGRPFDAVGREKIILDIYTLVRPIDAWSDNATLLVDPEQLEIRIVDPQVVRVEWSINGSPVPGANGEFFRPGDAGLEPGLYSVTVRVHDPTEWVRRNREFLEQSITWSVRYTTATEPRRPDSAELAANLDNLSLVTSPASHSLVSAGTLPPAKAVEQLQAVAAVVDNTTGDEGVFNPALWCTLPGFTPVAFLLAGFYLLTAMGWKRNP